MPMDLIINTVGWAVVLFAFFGGEWISNPALRAVWYNTHNVLGIVPLHEMGHVVAAPLCGLRVRSASFWLPHASLAVSGKGNVRFGLFLTALAGPAASMLPFFLLGGSISDLLLVLKNPLWAPLSLWEVAQRIQPESLWLGVWAITSLVFGGVYNLLAVMGAGSCWRWHPAQQTKPTMNNRRLCRFSSN
jgi:hypothetical protein